MIPRITQSEFSAAHVKEARPIVVIGALNDWRFSERWTPDHLATISGQREVTLSVSVDSIFRLNETADPDKLFAYERKRTTLADAVLSILHAQEGKGIYLMQESIPEDWSELWKNIVVPAWIGDPSARRGPWPKVNLWLGRNTSTTLHYDGANNLFAQLYGPKRFTLFAPDDTAYLSPYDLEAIMAHESHINADAPDMDKYPEFSMASPINVELEPGELLFLPAFWWHQVRAPEISVSVNIWSAPTVSQLSSCPNALRMLYGMYAQDRLASLKGAFLEPNDLDFLVAADLFLRKGNTWAACVLGLAAFDELIGNLHPEKRKSGCSLSSLSAHMQSECTVFSLDTLLPREHREAISTIPHLASKAAHFNADSLLGRQEVQTMLAAITYVSGRPRES